MVPVENVDYDARVTVIAEAMAMGPAVIVTRTGGQVDFVRDGVEGRYVPPGDAVALRAAIEDLLARPRRRSGSAGPAGRSWSSGIRSTPTWPGWPRSCGPRSRPDPAAGSGCQGAGRDPRTNEHERQEGRGAAGALQPIRAST